MQLPKTFHWKKQRKGSRCCGQIAVSIILNKSLSATFELFGKNKCTETKDLIRVLRKQNIKCSDKLKRKMSSKLAIAKLKYPNKTCWHWVVIHNKKIYDGIYGKRDGTVKWKKTWRITSYLEIYP